MPSDLAPFPDVEQALRDLLADLGTTGSVVPADLSAAMPFIRIQRFGGPSDQFFDNPKVAIDCFAGSRAAAYTLAESIRQRLISRPRLTAAGLIDHVVADTGPSEVPWGDVNVRRFAASYSVSTRR